MSDRKFWAFGAAFAVALLGDQLTKIWARATLKGAASIEVVARYFDLRYSENPGSAFGLFRDLSYARFLLLGVGLVALYVIFTFLRKLPAGRLRLAAELGLLAGGAVGNIIDRVVYQKVTDFIVWKAPMEGWLCGAIAKVLGFFGSDLMVCEWPTFNIADAALVVGVIALLIDARGEDLEPRPAGPPRSGR